MMTRGNPIFGNPGMMCVVAAIAAVAAMVTLCGKAFAGQEGSTHRNYLAAIHDVGGAALATNVRAFLIFQLR